MEKASLLKEPLAMKTRYCILDQNKMRLDRAIDVKHLLESSRETHFAIPDAALIEMTKNQKSRESTLRNSFEAIGAYPERVHVTYSISECLRTELETGTSMANCLLYPAASKFLRRILRALRDSTVDRSELNNVLHNQAHHAGLANAFFNHESNKRRLSELISAFKGELTEDQLTRLKKNKISDAERLAIIRELVPKIVEKMLVSEYKIRPEFAAGLISQKSITLRYYYLKIWACVEWLKFGGFENKAASQITNDLLDHEYVLTALSFDDLLSNDKKMVKSYDELKQILEIA